MHGQSLITKTKTKTRTKVGVVALALFIGTGMMAGIGTLLSGGNVCNTGSRVGLTCRTNLDCRVKSTDTTAQCVGSKTLPDLIIQSVTFDPVTHLPTVAIKNQGLTPALWGTPAENTLQVNIQWRPSTDDTRYTSGSTLGEATTGSTTTALGPSASTNVAFTAPTYPFPLDARRARICVDVGVPGVLESKESNNCWEGPVTLPDLVIKSVTFDPVTYKPDVLIKNQGLGSAQWGTPAENTLQTNTQWMPSADDTRYTPDSILGEATTDSTTSILRSGESTNVSFYAYFNVSLYDSFLPDTRRARICVDVGTPGVLEINEANNCWEGPVTPPDLAIQSVTFDPTTRMPTVVIINQGDFDIFWASTRPGPPLFALTAYTDEGILATEGIFANIPALAPGATYTFAWPTLVMSSTAVRMRIALDTRNQVHEFNETNNVWEGDLPSLTASVPQARFNLHPASPSGSGVPGYNEVLRFNVSASGGDVFIQNILLGAEVFGLATGTGWDRNNSFMNSWRIYDTTDLSTPIGNIIVEPLPGSISGPMPGVWRFYAMLELGESGITISSDTTRTFVLKVDTTGASAIADDNMIFYVQRSLLWIGSGSLHEEILPSGDHLVSVRGNRLIY